MRFTPHRYQQYAVDRILTEPNIGLFLDMGLGKTVITLTAIRDLMYDSYEISKVLVIAPKSVAESTWTAEASKWEHLKDLRVSKVLGSSAERLAALHREADIYVINRENVVWLYDHLGDAPKFDMCVVDESSSFKNHQAKRFRALRKMRPMFDRMVLLTGTPTANGLMDLWAQMYLLDQGKRLGRTITVYRQRWFKPDKTNGMIVYSYKLLPGAEDEITDTISDITFSLKAEDYIRLPERVDNVIRVEMPAKAKEQYKKMEKEYILAFPDDTQIVANDAAGLSNKLLQLANGFAYDPDKKAIEIHRAKLEALTDIVDTAPGPVLVFYEFIHDREQLLQLPGAKQLQSDQDVKDWNAGKIKVLLAHPASAGYGLNLQAGGSTIVWYGMPWSLELYQQANARLHRQGQKRTVVIHHLVTADTMDESVLAALQKKRKGQDAMLEAVKAKLEEYKKDEQGNTEEHKKTKQR